MSKKYKPKGPNHYTKPCPANGVEHDCTQDYLMYWDRDLFDRWLEDVKHQVWREGFIDLYDTSTNPYRRWDQEVADR